MGVRISGLALRLDREEAAPGEVVWATMENHGPHAYTAGNPYGLELIERDESVPPPSRSQSGESMAFTLEAYPLPLGGEFTSPVHLPAVLTPGVYRVTKDARVAVRGRPPGRRVQVSAELRIRVR